MRLCDGESLGNNHQNWGRTWSAGKENLYQARKYLREQDQDIIEQFECYIDHRTRIKFDKINARSIPLNIPPLIKREEQVQYDFYCKYCDRTVKYWKLSEEARAVYFPKLLPEVVEAYRNRK